jgi:hypothetical protein
MSGGNLICCLMSEVDCIAKQDILGRDNVRFHCGLAPRVLRAAAGWRKAAGNKGDTRGEDYVRHAVRQNAILAVCAGRQ